MIGVYFSGTGNTKFCVDKFLAEYGHSEKAFSIEEKEALDEIQNNHEIVIGYPVQYSNIPKILRDWVIANPAEFLHFSSGFRKWRELPHEVRPLLTSRERDTLHATAPFIDLFCSVNAVAGIAESRKNIAVFVQALVLCADENVYIRMCSLELFNAFRCRNQA